MERPPVSIIIPIWNQWNATRMGLDALRPTLGVRDEVIVIDNGSTDETPYELNKYSWLKVITNEENLGFAKANNQGAAIATHDILIFLNNDTITTKGWIDSLVAGFVDDDERVGAIGPRSNYVSGPQIVTDVPYSDQPQLPPIREFSREWMRDHRDQYDDVERLVGFCVAIRRAAFDEIGGWDERYEVGGFEDDDLCTSLIQHGWKLRIAHGCYVHHWGHLTFEGNNVDRMNIQDINSAKYSKKHGSEVLISACMIIKDEEDLLANCLESIKGFADEIVIYDTGSEDRSIEIAREYGATVIEGYWDDDFGRARNEALNACSGEWILHLDADETIEQVDQAAITNILRMPGGPTALLIPIINHGDAITGGDIEHQALRLFKRSLHKWQGRLHEQVVLKNGDPRTNALFLKELVIHHYGYTAELMRGRDKLQRNVRLARADVEDGGDLAYKKWNLARSLQLSGQTEEAVVELFEAREIADNNGTSKVVRRNILRSGAEILLSIGRPQDAIEWADELEKISDRNDMARYLRGQAYLNVGDTERSLEEFDGLDEASDQDGLNYGEEAIHTRRGLTHVAAQNWEQAIEELTLAIEQGTKQAVWFPLACAYDGAKKPFAEIASLIKEEDANSAFSQFLLGSPVVCDEIGAAYWSEHMSSPSVLAWSIRFAPRLPVEKALEWSARLRGVGIEEHCPLIAIAGNFATPANQRLRAAVLCYAAFNDERAPGLITTAAGALEEGEFLNALVEMNELAPALLPGFVMGVATTPRRCLAIARVLGELGAKEEAISICEHGLSLPGLNDAIKTQMTEWIERTATQIRADV